MIKKRTKKLENEFGLSPQGVSRQSYLEMEYSSAQVLKTGNFKSESASPRERNNVLTSD